MKAELLERTLRATDAALWAGLVAAEQLPVVGAALLADDVDTPSLGLLAGLDLTPFHPHDARELFEAVLAEVPIERPSIEERFDLAGQLVGSMYSRDLLSMGEAWKLCTGLANPDDHGSHAFARLYYLQDEWDGDWGRSKREVEAEVHDIFVEMADGEPPHRALAEAIVAKCKK